MSDIHEQGSSLITSKGLGPAARYILAFFATLFGIIMFLSAPQSNQPVWQRAFEVFCFLISVACITRGHVRQFIGSCIGSAIFVSAVWYLVTEAVDGGMLSGPSAPSLFNALRYMIFFGLPSIVYVWRARFGLRRVLPKSEPEVQETYKK